MTQEIRTMKAALQLPGMESAVIERYDDSGLNLDLYFPAERGAAPLAAVVVALGYPAPQARQLGIFTSWARLLAASGIVGVVYDTQNPGTDIGAVFARLRTHPAIDGERIGVWAFSGHGPTGLSILLEGQARCGVISCGYLMDLDGSTAVADAAAEYRFANPTAGRELGDLPPLFVARAGLDHFPGVNESIDRFVAHALRRNLPVTLVNHPTGMHGFDFSEDSETARNLIRSMLAFLRVSLA